MYRLRCRCRNVDTRRNIDKIHSNLTTFPFFIHIGIDSFKNKILPRINSAILQNYDIIRVRLCAYTLDINIAIKYIPDIPMLYIYFIQKDRERDEC